MAIETGRKTYTLVRKSDCHVLGTWSNLKYLCATMETKTVFPSYWTLARMDKEGGVLEFEAKDGVQYKVCISVINAGEIEIIPPSVKAENETPISPPQ